MLCFVLYNAGKTGKAQLSYTCVEVLFRYQEIGRHFPFKIQTYNWWLTYWSGGIEFIAPRKRDRRAQGGKLWTKYWELF